MPKQSASSHTKLCFIEANGRPNFCKLHAEMRKGWPDEAQLVFMALLLHDTVDRAHLRLSEREQDLDGLCCTGCSLPAPVQTFFGRPAALRAPRQLWFQGNRLCIIGPKV